jgi:hypothetical protein
MEALNRGLRRTAVGHFDEAKPFGAAGVTVSNETHFVHGTIRLEELAKVVISGSIRKIADKDIHAVVLW